jgi:hypothetical protein
MGQVNQSDLPIVFLARKKEGAARGNLKTYTRLTNPWGDGPKLSHINADEERREYKAKHCPPTGQAQAATYGRAPES